MSGSHPGSRIISTTLYREAAAAIDWLCEAFGFDRHLIVADPDAHQAVAVAAGAHVVLRLADQIQGGRACTCRDPEGQVRTFGDYDPRQDD